jgi:hypothetical protein
MKHVTRCHADSQPETAAISTSPVDHQYLRPLQNHCIVFDLHSQVLLHCSSRGSDSVEELETLCPDIVGVINDV